MDIKIKRGETFNYAGTVNLPAGNWTAAAHVETAGGNLVGALTVSLAPPVSRSLLWTISLTASTVAWPIGNFVCDVRFSSGTEILISPTITITVEREVTGA